MEIIIYLTAIFLVLLYLIKPITKLEEENFKDKNNWRGGF